jgi:thioredoxin reductase (NADPH)
MNDSTSPDDVANPRLTEAEIAALTEVGTRVSLRDGDSLFQAGEHRGGFFVVLEGAVEIISRSGGEERGLTVHGPGQFTGDIDIVTRRRPVVSAAVRGDTQLVSVRSSEVRRIIGDRPRLGEKLLRAFIARRQQLLESGFDGLRLIGSASSAQTFRIREFLSRNQVPFTWDDIDEKPGIAKLLGDFGVREHDLPVVAAGARPLLRNPSVRELAEALGLRRPIRTSLYDLVIVGAGPAGLAAAVYGASEGLRTLVLEAVAPGGQAGTSTRIENYLGFPTGISGAELTGRATLQAQKFGAELSSPSAATGLELDRQYAIVHLDTGERATARCVLIAVGADYRKLDISGRERFDGVGIYYAATPMEVSACRGSDVAVVGGGNSAGQAVVFLAEHTRHVWLLLRGDDLGRSMSSYLVRRIEAAENVEVLYDTAVREVLGDDELERVVVENNRTGERRTLDTPAVFTFIGAAPRTTWLPPQIATDRRGFVLTGRAVAASALWQQARQPLLLETSHPGVFAAGDVRLGAVPRVASAVGEGAMAVKFVHEYLAEG